MDQAEIAVELQHLVREHEELRSRIESENAWWREVRELGKPRFGEMGFRLAHFRERLASHFEREESLEESAIRQSVCKASPDQFQTMVGDHRDLLGRLDKIIAKANDSGGSYACWGDIGLEFSELIHAIDEHESEELRLLAEILGRIAPPRNAHAT